MIYSGRQMTRHYTEIAGWIGRIVAVLLGGAAILVVAAILFLNTGYAHRYILRLTTERLQQATGARVQIGDLAFHRAHLGADFYGIQIYSDSSSKDEPLFSADRVSVDIGLHLFQPRKIEVNDVTLDRPVLRVTIDGRGASNLPRPAKTSVSSSNTSTNLFNMAIGHLRVNGGEIFYNDRRTPVTAEARDLQAQAAYANLTKTYDSSITYRDARVRYGTLAPFTHDLQLSFAANPSGVKIRSLQLRSGLSRIQAQGELANYAAPDLKGTYQASLATSQIENIFRNAPERSPEAISGQVDAQGTFSYRNNPEGTTIANLFVDGKLSGQAVQWQSRKNTFTARSLSADFVLQQDTLDVTHLQAALLGGQAAGELQISDVTGKAVSRLRAGLQGVDLSALRSAVGGADLSQVRVGGHLGGSLRASWHGSAEDFQLTSNVHLSGTVGSTAKATDSFAVSGEGQFTYNGPAQIVTVQNAFLNMPHNHLTVQGGLGSHANLKVDASSNDLHEVDLLVLLFRTSGAANEPSAAPALLGLGGSGGFTGTISGPLTDPEFAGTLSANHLLVRGTTVQSLQTTVEVSPRGVAARRGNVTFSKQSKASFDVSAGLTNWKFNQQQPVVIRVNASKVSLADLEHVAGMTYPVSGLVNADVAISGTQENPNARGNIQLTQANLWQQPVQNLNVQFHNAGHMLQSTLNVQTAAGSAAGSIDYNPNTKEYGLQLDSPAIRVNQIQYIQTRGQKFSGVIHISARGQGNLNSPQVQITIGGQQLQIGEQKIENFTAEAGVVRQRAQFNLACSISGAALRSSGIVDLTGDYQATANIDSQVIQLHTLLATFVPQTRSDLQGETEFHGTLKGPLKDLSKLEAHLQIPSFKIGYPQIQLAATSPIHVDYQRAVLTLKPARFQGTDTDITVEGAAALQRDAALEAKVAGKVDFQLLEIWNPQWRSSGQIDLNVGVRGTRAQPEIKGTLAVSDGTLATETLPTLEKLNGELEVSGTRVQVKTLQGRLGGGPVEIHGFATYRPSVQYNLGMTARRIRIFYPDGVRSQVSADLNFTGAPASSNLTGQATIDALSLMQDFDLASFSSRFDAPSAPPTGMTQNIKLNVGLSSGRQLEVASNQLSIQGTADLRIVGTVAEPVIIGRTNLTSGEFFYNGRRFEIQNASIGFANPVRTEPVLNLTATTEVNQFQLTVNLVGPFDRLRTSYTSDPPLAPVDVINLLIRGQTTEAAQRTTTTPQSVIAGQLAGQVSDRLQKLTGISSLTIDPQLGGNQGNGASQLAIQQRVTKNLFFTFATDVTTTQGELVQVEYQFSRKFSMSAIRDQTGGYQIEIKSHKTF
jgi:translocation and assembly module TamB